MPSQSRAPRRAGPSLEMAHAASACPHQPAALPASFASLPSAHIDRLECFGSKGERKASQVEVSTLAVECGVRAETLGSGPGWAQPTLVRGRMTAELPTEDPHTCPHPCPGSLGSTSHTAPSPCPRTGLAPFPIRSIFRSIISNSFPKGSFSSPGDSCLKCTLGVVFQDCPEPAWVTHAPSEPGGH